MDRTAVSVENLRSVYDMMSLKGKVALVSGAAGGIGRTSAATMAEVGASVVLTDLPEKAQCLSEIAAHLRNKYNADVLELAADVSDEAQVKAMYAAVKEHFGRVDVVHSNAGYVTPNDNTDMALSVWEKMLSVNFTGAMLVAREGAALMKEGQRGGSIIFTSSMSGHIINRRPDGVRYSPTYASTKAAVRHLAKSMAMDYIPHKIRVNSISPGYILSGMHDRFAEDYLEFMADQVPMRRFGTLNELAGAILYFASDLGSYSTGTDLLVDGGHCVW